MAEEEICFVKGPSGAFCTLPKGHTGDHIAEPTYKGNIIDAFREGVPSGQGHSGVVKVKGGCALVFLAFGAGVYGVIDTVVHVL